MTVSFLPSAREDVIIASTTLFPAGTAEGSVRGAAALIAAAEAIRWGYALVVVDGGSDPGFIKSLKELGVEVHVQSKP